MAKAKKKGVPHSPSKNKNKTTKRIQNNNQVLKELKTQIQNS